MEPLNGRLLLSAVPLFADNFSSTNSSDINAGVSAAGRQSGYLASSAWTESSATAGGTYDYLSQVNHNVANTLLLATNAPAGRMSTYAATSTAPLDPQYGLSRVQVEITPLGIYSTGATTDHWAGISIGGAAGSNVNAAGVSGVLVRDTGSYQIWENGVKVQSGTLSATSFAIDYQINPVTGQYTLSINGTSLYSGAHATPYSSGTITLLNYSVSTSTGVQIDYFKNFSTTGTTKTLIQDQFNSAGSADINAGIATRQSGLFSPMTWIERDETGSNVSWLTQVNNGSVANTLLLGTVLANNIADSYVSTPTTLLSPRFGMTTLSTSVTPQGPNSTAASDHWAGLAIGGPTGTTLTAAGVSGIFIRPGGSYGVYENGASVATGTASGTNFQITYTFQASGAYTVTLNGVTVYSGVHTGGFTGGQISMQSHTGAGATGNQLDYWTPITVEGFASLADANQAYYLSPTGNDANDGKTPATAWKTIAKANSLVYRPGDSILFQGGQSFTGNLTLHQPDSGTSAAPLTISTYGSGVATLNADANSAIGLRDTQYVNISNLKLVGSGYSSNTGSGIDLTTECVRVFLNHYTIDNVEASGFGHCGISLYASSNDISVTNSNLHDNGDGGMLVMNRAGYVGQRVYVGHVMANHNAGSSLVQSGYGILVNGASDVVIERDVATDNGWLAGQSGAVGGIQAINCDKALLQYNESAFTHMGSADGDGIVIDSSTHSVMQYNYTHDNEGAGLWMGAESAVTASNNVMRYNLSQNDGRKNDGYGGIMFWTNSGNGGKLSNTDVYGNTVYMSPNANGYASSAVAFGQYDGTGLHIRNNVFYVAGNGTVTSRFIRYLSGGTDVLFQGNDYYSATGTFSLIWRGTTFNSMANWRTWAPEQETLSSTAVYRTDNPLFSSPGTAETINDPDHLSTSISQYVLGASSLLKNTALDLSQFGIIWDPDGMGADSFFTGRFSATPKDFYGTTLPTSGTGSWSIGASK